MAQSWHDLLFAHWPVEVDLVRNKIPNALSLDTFGGQAWIGVVPFRMSGVRLRGTPAVPRLSAFPELNVRTYVSAEGKSGVWFFSLDAANRIAVEVARAWFRLPYFQARMSCELEREAVNYSSLRQDDRAPAAKLLARYKPQGAAFTAKTGTLEHWLTERYCLYTQNRRGEILRSEIHHPPWSLQAAEAEIVENSMAQAAGVALPSITPLLHFSRRQDVLVWPLRKI